MLNVVAAGHSGPIDYNDMGLRKTYSLRTLRPAIATYTDMVMEVSLMLIVTLAVVNR